MGGKWMYFVLPSRWQLGSTSEQACKRWSSSCVGTQLGLGPVASITWEARRQKWRACCILRVWKHILGFNIFRVILDANNYVFYCSGEHFFNHTFIGTVSHICCTSLHTLSYYFCCTPPFRLGTHILNVHVWIYSIFKWLHILVILDCSQQHVLGFRITAGLSTSTH